MTAQYSEIQLDALRELANIGSGTAATALSQMVGRPIDLSVPTVLALPLADAVDAAGAGEQDVWCVVLPISGDMDAVVLMIFTPEDAAAVCNLLGVELDDEVGPSALGEVGNILGSSYIGALGQMTGLALEPRPPETTADMLAAIVATVLASIAHSKEVAFLLDSSLVIEGEACSFQFMLVPSQEGVIELLSRLGL